jgi:SLT domain-containing protein
MSRGKVVERGNHDELLSQNGLYFSLMNSQENKDSNDDENTDMKKKSLESRKISLLEMNLNQINNTNKVTEINTTEEQMNHFDVFSFTSKMMQLNNENII